MKRISILIVLYCISCIASADTFISEDIITNPTPSHFNICHGGSCENITDVSLNKEQWKIIIKLFSGDRSVKDERRSIKLAIAKMELIVGKLTDTYNDKAENNTDDQFNHYMDCIDESTNTTIYMTMMQENGLIRLHTIGDRGNRGYFFNGWPHTTAVIKEIRTGTLYAVDSWFLDNGQQPFIIPLNSWFDGWRPVKITK